MKSFSSINTYIENLVKSRRKNYYEKLKKKLRNPDPTILANNCIGTFIYNNLGLKFNSPTVNLSMNSYDFLAFAANLEGYLNAQLIEEESSSYPIGSLEYKGKKILIHFVHYESFDDARKKWYERAARINLQNTYVIMCVDYKHRKSMALFDKLPYEHKMYIGGRNLTRSHCFVKSKPYSKRKVKPGIILKYKSRYSAKRWMDDIDYVSFLNRGH